MPLLGVCKRPAASDGAFALKRPAGISSPTVVANQVIPDHFKPPFSVCKCGRPLANEKEVMAKCYDLIGVKDVVHHTKRCTSSSCRLMFGYNYYWLGGRKMNNVGMADLSDGVLFLSSKRCYTLRYLKLCGDLLFRGCLSSRAFAWAYGEAFRPDADIEKRYGKDVHVRHDQYHTSAVMYYFALQELEPLNLHMSIELENEISDASLKAYDKHLHTQVLPPTDRSAVRELVGDGHSKVLTKCTGHIKHSGRPRTCKSTRKQSYTNGWFFVCDPSGRVLGVQEQVHPENNKTVAASLGDALPMYPNVDCFVYDRNCSFAPSYSKIAAFKQIKHWPVDKFHGHRHTAKCRYSPKNVPKYKRRLAKVNTQACEQVFSWFRGYAKVLNEMRANRNKFLVRVLVRKHNDLLGDSGLAHLGPLPKKKPSKRYSCAKKAPRTH